MTRHDKEGRDQDRPDLQAQQIITYSDIDWQLLWRNGRARKSWKPSSADDWSNRAEPFAKRTMNSPFVAMVLAHLDVDTTSSVLDVGCGPGTLALPVARRVMSVTAIDHAAGMINKLQENARLQRLTNIHTRCCSWIDDWAAHDIGVHDIAIASRSLNIERPSDAIDKLIKHASRLIYIIEPVAPTPFDPDAFAAIGRPFEPGPDYIYTLNTLYSMGIHPRVEQAEAPALTVYHDREAAMERYRWMFKDLSSGEEKRLATFLASRSSDTDADGFTVTSRFPQRWAILSWSLRETIPKIVDER